MISRWLAATVVLCVAALLSWPTPTFANPSGTSSSAVDAAAKPPPTIRAVLVGASTYSEPRLVPLPGARNDALLMAQTLIGLGAAPGNLAILVSDAGAADYPVPAGVRLLGGPTRANILAAVKSVISAAHSGDRVYILLSGHGLQQVTRTPELEPDGLDEVYLAADVALPPNDKFTAAGTSTIPVTNAILDKEIGKWIGALRQNGVDVVFIGDFCHSGDATRGASAGDQPLADSWATDLGTDNSSAPAPSSAPVRGASEGAGRFVAFLAAPSDQEAQQFQGPILLASAQRHVHGALTSSFAVALATAAQGSYREAADIVTESYKRLAMVNHKPFAPPDIGGDLDMSITGAAGQSAEPSWLVVKPKGTAFTSLELPAGTVQNLTSGTIISLSVSSLDARHKLVETPVLYGQISDTGQTSSTLTPVSFGDIAADRWQDIKEPVVDSDGNTHSYDMYDERILIARVAKSAMSADITVGLPAEATAPGAKAAIAAVRHIVTAANSGLALDTAHDPAISVRLLSDRVELLRGTSEVVMGTIAMSGDTFDGAALQLALQRAARAERLRRILSQGAITPGSAGAGSLRISGYLWRAPSAGGPSSDCPPGPDFADTKNPPKGVAPITAGAIGSVELAPCDTLYLVANNDSGQDIDLTSLVVTPQARIHVLDDTSDPPGRIRAHQQGVFLEGWQIDDNGTAPGSNDIMVGFISIPVDPALGVEQRLTELAQSSIGTNDEGSGSTRGASTTPAALRGLRDLVLNGESARLRSAATTPQGDAHIESLAFTVRPRSSTANEH